MSFAKNVIQALPAIAPLLGLLFAALQGVDKTRRNVAQDAEAVSKLPDGPARDELLKVVHDEIKQLVDPSRSRDYPMLVVSHISAPALGWAAIWLYDRGVWWGYVSAIPVAVFGLVFVYGIFETAQLVPRDRKGIANANET